MPIRLSVVLAVALLSVALFQGTRGLYETTEGRYAECAREMAERGTWLEPFLNGKPHWTKPPVTYLAIRLPYAVLGPTTWAARLYLIPCFLISVWAAWRLAFLLWNDERTARLSAMVYATSGIPLLASQSTTADYPLAAALALAQVAFWSAFRYRSRLAVYAMWFFMGWAFLTKGPPALLFLAAMAVTWFRLPKDDRRRVSLFSPGALLVFLLVGFGWYAWEAWHTQGLMKYWLHDEVVERSFSSKFKRNAAFYRNFLIYLPVLMFGAFPWTAWLFLRWRETVRRAGLPKRFRGWLSELSDQKLWMAWTLIFPVCIFALSRSKLPFYLLPLFVPIAVCAARLLVNVYGADPRFKRAVLGTWLAGLLLFVVVKGVYAYWPSELDMKRLQESLVRDGTVSATASLASLGDRPLNGLSYYRGREVSAVLYDGLPQWVAAGGGPFLLYHEPQLDYIKTCLAGRSFVKRPLVSNWCLMVIGPLSAEPKQKREEGGK
jgi:4-amino-4-deoxy-L-arabinose transferase